jgi:hypothetical protein
MTRKRSPKETLYSPPAVFAATPGISSAPPGQRTLYQLLASSTSPLYKPEPSTFPTPVARHPRTAVLTRRLWGLLCTSIVVDEHGHQSRLAGWMLGRGWSHVIQHETLLPNRAAVPKTIRDQQMLK